MKTILLASLVLITLSSCEKVINIKLKESEKQIVIDAKLYEGTNDFIVKITKTSNYFDNQQPEFIDVANVKLTDNSGTTTLNYTGNGIYKLPNYTAITNNSYQLDVIIDGKHYYASAYMPTHVNVDTLTYTLTKNAKGDSVFTVSGAFTDPAGIKNYYRVVNGVNQKIKNTPADLLVTDDLFFDGNQFSSELFTENYHSSPKDTAKIELLTMDENVFKYITSLYSILNDGSSLAPANPNTNITGGALGVFAVYARSKKSIIIY